MGFVEFCLAGVGAFFGGCLRALLADVFNQKKDSYPYGTLLANLIGSLLVGIFLGIVATKGMSNASNVLLITGFCGGLTTFSTFSLEVYQLFANRHDQRAIIYWIGSCVLCICCVFLGLALQAWFK
ncbi:fluoride efflux transporter CrcB [Streptococcus sp. zg-JUN1979]|uniref:fluoride efflux transporter CrcB n=1 Tax=Streptococcus sp. zg-JUN1979 TaxID=3391450 RepID=UPI0039A60F76